jgi:hypothetical protein
MDHPFHGVQSAGLAVIDGHQDGFVGLRGWPDHGLEDPEILAAEAAVLQGLGEVAAALVDEG